MTATDLTANRNVVSPVEPPAAGNIPRRIIQTARTRELPPLSRAAVAGLKCLNPDFEYRFFDDTDVLAFVRQEFPEYEGVFNGFRFRIQKYDFFRYLAVYRLGGFYFDLDVFLEQQLSPLLSSKVVFPFEELSISRFLEQRFGIDWEIGNYAFGAESENPFLKAVIGNCVTAQQNREWVEPMLRRIPLPFRADFHVLYTTGPGLLTRTLAENPALAKNVTVLFPNDVCDQSQWHLFGAFGSHLMQGSWRPSGGRIRRRLANAWHARCLTKTIAKRRLAGANCDLTACARSNVHSLHQNRAP
jgi:inositol phosphorylceramide mannosyltransferase catalytic subunit